MANREECIARACMPRHHCKVNAVALLTMALLRCASQRCAQCNGVAHACSQWHADKLPVLQWVEECAICAFNEHRKGEERWVHLARHIDLRPEQAALCVLVDLRLQPRVSRAVLLVDFGASGQHLFGIEPLRAGAGAI